ncbi:MAG: DUF1861 family protein [Sporolactobacillus sp.]
MSKIAASCSALLEAYRSKRQPIYEVEKLKFQGTGTRDVYNITAPFSCGSKTLIAGRVEARVSEASTLCFFEKTGQIWQLMSDVPALHLQDPAITQIGGQLILGGVEVLTISEGRVNWRTVLYKGEAPDHLRRFFVGPKGMKDIRLHELPDGKILVLTRPQGKRGGRGKIGYLLLSSLDELDRQELDDAPLLDGYFIEEDWGGANEIHSLKNDWVGVLGHIAYFDDARNRHYYSMVFALNPETGEHTPIEIIATRADFLDGPSKRPDLKDVVFSGGAVREQGKLILYVGTSDTEAQKILLDDPFEKYEQQNVADIPSTAPEESVSQT